MSRTSVLVCVLAICAIGDAVSEPLKPRDPCSVYGDYETITSHPVVHLRTDGKAACRHTCPGAQTTVPQVACLGGTPGYCNTTSEIVSATCIYLYQDTFSMRYYECVFLNATGYVVPVARYSFELEYESNHDDCVLRNSFRVWYNQGRVYQKAFLIVVCVTIGCIAVVLVTLVSLCIFFCCRKKPRDEPLLLPSDMSRTVY